VLFDRLPVILAALSSLATTVLGDHTNDADLCAVCGSAWPCERATTAAHNLAVL
jgi:hypothetical protein